jgi:hypothetical protein
MPARRPGPRQDGRSTTSRRLTVPDAGFTFDHQPAARVVPFNLPAREQIRVVGQQFLQLGLRVTGGTGRLGQRTVIANQEDRVGHAAMQRRHSISG